MKRIGSYRQSSVVTADRMELVVMLYDGFLSLAHAALAAYEESDQSRAGQSTGQALAVVHELNAALDRDANPELAGSLASLYEFVDYCLQQASRTKDAQHVRNAIQVMGELRDGWSQASVQLRSKAA
jgi:flagellar secretion chaperone FliS